MVLGLISPTRHPRSLDSMDLLIRCLDLLDRTAGFSRICIRVVSCAIAPSRASGEHILGSILC